MERKIKYLELVEGSFNESHFSKQTSQYPYVAYSIKDGKVIYTIVLKEEEDMWIISVVELKDISNCTYNMVDLGLPSGLKWADRNVGAKNPEHYGSYFQWGEIVRDEDGKPTSNAYTYREITEITTEQLVNILNPLIGPGITVDNIKDVLASQGVTGNDLRDSMKAAGINAVSINKNFNWDSYFDKNLNKYNVNGGLTVLESSDDAAYIHMGSNYRMPTIDEIRELINNTTMPNPYSFEHQMSKQNEMHESLMNKLMDQVGDLSKERRLDRREHIAIALIKAHGKYNAIEQDIDFIEKAITKDGN